MKTKVIQHVESEWMREWESVRVREWECESERVSFEHRHENKSCSACPEDQLKPFKFLKISKISNFQIF